MPILLYMAILVSIIGKLVVDNVVLDVVGLGLGEFFVFAEVGVTFNNDFPVFAGEFYLAEAIIDEGKTPVVHDFMLYPNMRRSQEMRAIFGSRE